MRRLLTVELRRLFARRLVVLTMVGALLATLLVLLSAWQSAQPMSEQELAVAEKAYQDELEYWEENGEEMVAQCLEDEAAESEATGQQVDWGCADYGPPEREWYVRTAPLLEQSLPGYVAGYAQVLLLAALLVGATSTAAELTTGAMGTWLTFEPRRLRVYGSKVLAAALGAVPFAVAGTALVVAGVSLIAVHFEVASGMGGDEWAAVAGTAARVVALAVVAALVGAALGFLLRHTAAVLGVAVVYLIGEGMVRGLVPGSAPWVLGTNVQGWLARGTTYAVETCTTDATGTMCEYTEHVLSFGQSAAYLGILALAVTVIGAVVFRRRDAA